MVVGYWEVRGWNGEKWERVREVGLRLRITALGMVHPYKDPRDCPILGISLLPTSPTCQTSAEPSPKYLDTTHHVDLLLVCTSAAVAAVASSLQPACFTKKSSGRLRYLGRAKSGSRAKVATSLPRSPSRTLFDVSPRLMHYTCNLPRAAREGEGDARR